MIGRIACLCVFSAALAALMPSCATANGELTGGELTEAGSLASISPIFDGGITNEVVTKLCTDNADWADIYKTMLGPTNQPGSCVLNGSCHGTPTGEGAKAGAGILCVDEFGCCQSMFQKNLIIPRSPRRGVTSVMRHLEDGKKTGFMPKEPADFLYTEAQIAKVRAWIASAAPAADASTSQPNDASTADVVDASADAPDGD